MDYAERGADGGSCEREPMGAPSTCTRKVPGHRLATVLPPIPPLFLALPI